MKAFYKQLPSPKTKPRTLSLAALLIVLFSGSAVSSSHAAGIVQFQFGCYRMREDEGAVRIGVLRVGEIYTILGVTTTVWLKKKTQHKLLGFSLT